MSMNLSGVKSVAIITVVVVSVCTLIREVLDLLAP